MDKITEMSEGYAVLINQIKIRDGEIKDLEKRCEDLRAGQLSLLKHINKLNEEMERLNDYDERYED